MSRRYLTLDEVKQALGRGRTVEQWLGASVQVPLGPVVHWLRIESEPDGRFSVWRVDVLDPRQQGLYDVYEFLPLDVDEPNGIAEVLATFDAAIDYVCETLGGSRDRFVNEGVIQDEYREHVENIA